MSRSDTCKALEGGMQAALRDAHVPADVPWTEPSGVPLGRGLKTDLFYSHSGGRESGEGRVNFRRLAFEIGEGAVGCS